MKTKWLEKTQNGDYIISPLLPEEVEESPYKLLTIIVLPLTNWIGYKTKDETAHIIEQLDNYDGEVKTYCNTIYPVEYLVMPKAVFGIDDITISEVCQDCSLYAEHNIIILDN